MAEIARWQIRIPRDNVARASWISQRTDHLDLCAEWVSTAADALHADRRPRTSTCHTFIARLLLFVGENLHVLTARSHHLFFFFFLAADVTITCFPLIPLCHTSTSCPSISGLAGLGYYFSLPSFYLCFLIACEKYGKTLLIIASLFELINLANLFVLFAYCTKTLHIFCLAVALKIFADLFYIFMGTVSTLHTIKIIREHHMFTKTLICADISGYHRKNATPVTFPFHTFQIID